MQDEQTSDLARAGLVIGGKFRLDACIGQGGMGSVWSATHLGLGNQIAIKLVSREFVRSPEALRRFDAEAKAAARLQSRHVVQVHDNGTLEDGTPYIAMELLSGESLQQRIDRTGPISIDETVAILAQCCKALGRAHAVGIVHRDIKPDNIYLSQSPDDDAYVVKILDFGVAKISFGTGDQGSTKTGAVLGTPLYMSPEQARGLKGIDHRSDLYSLGIVAYTMLTGRIAFYGESFGDILLKICTEPLPAMHLVANVPPALDAWFQRVCARDPAQRCGSAQEFIDTLRAAAGIHVMSSPGVMSGPASLGSPAGGRQHATVDSDAPWRLPPVLPAQSVAEANVTIIAPDAAAARGRKVGVAVAVSVLGALVLVGGGTVWMVAGRHPHPRSTEVTPASALPQSATVAVTQAPPPPTAPVVLPPAVDPMAKPAETAAPPPTTSASGRHGPVSEAHLQPVQHASGPTHPAPPPHPEPPPPPTSKPPNSVDLGY